MHIIRCSLAKHLWNLDFPGGSDGKASAYNAGDLGSIPGSGSSLEKEMATHSSTPAWRIPGTEQPGWLPSMGSHRVGHDWSDLAAAAAARRRWRWTVTYSEGKVADS